MSERAPLPSSVTQHHAGEVSPVSTPQEATKSKRRTSRMSDQRYNQSEKGKERSEHYRKSEKGKKVYNEASKRWNRKHRLPKIARELPHPPLGVIHNLAKLYTFV